MRVEEAFDRKGVVVVGAGAIGSHLLEHLARMQEIERVTIIDRDTYEAKNVLSQRTTIYDKGKKKAQVWGRRLKHIRPGLRVLAIAADVRDVPLGLLRSDLMLSCVDSRLARQTINERAHRLAVPWIDAGVEAGSLLVRMNAYMPANESPCPECPWGDADYAALEVEYACRKQKQEMPTDAPSALGALAASLQALEVQKIFRRQGDVAWGRQVLIDARTHKHYAGRYTRNPNCRFDHRVWKRIASLDCAAGEMTIGQAFQMDRNNAADAGDLALSVENGPFVHKLICFECGRAHSPGPLPTLQASLTGARCDQCDGELKAPGTELLSCIERKSLRSEQLALPIAALGLRAGDVYTVSGAQDERHFQIPYEESRYSA